MKNLFLKCLVITSLLGFIGCKNSTDPASWSSAKIDKWFEKGEWLNGWTAIPDGSINRKEFATAYFKNKERWDKAFTYLKTTDLANLEVKRTEIDGINIYAPVTEYLTKNRGDVNFEAHRKYIDIQYVIKGEEMIGVAPMAMKDSVVVPYDETKDIEFLTVKEGSELKATPERFFLFFPSDIHRPSLTVNENSQVKKIVVKVKID
jgi:YhcH/YjgK/YiaL family protein